MKNLLPNAFKAILTLILISCGSVGLMALEMPLTSTPYDQQMERIVAVLNTPVGMGRGDTSDRVQAQGSNLEQVETWMKEIRRLRYVRTSTWQTPSETLSKRSGDCKDKSVLLLAWMKEHGYQDMKLVIGLQKPNSQQTHAWIEWNRGGIRYILDPTMESKPMLASPASKEYAAQYSYAEGKKFAHMSRQLMMAGL